MFRYVFLMFALAALVFAQAASQTPAAPAQPAPARDPGLYATMNTTQGVIVVKLFEQETPVTVRNFVALARGTKAWLDQKSGQKVTRPLYPGTTFHRVIPGFMIQGGDPDRFRLGRPRLRDPGRVCAQFEVRPARSPGHGQRRTAHG